MRGLFTVYIDRTVILDNFAKVTGFFARKFFLFVLFFT